MIGEDGKDVIWHVGEFGDMLFLGGGRGESHGELAEC